MQGPFQPAWKGLASAARLNKLIPVRQRLQLILLDQLPRLQISADHLESGTGNILDDHAPGLACAPAQTLKLP